MEEAHNLSKRYGFKIVEDASHALGGSYQGEKVGCCQYSDITISSFHPVKGITTGEGGIVLTNDVEIARRVARLRTHGITRDSDLMQYPDGIPWHYEQIELGYNYRITDIQCSLGLSQLSHLDTWVARRNELAIRYNDLFKGGVFAVQKEFSDVLSARHLYVIRIPEGKRDFIGIEMRKQDILVNVHYEPIHLQPYYRGLGFKVGDFPESERYGADALSIPLFPALTFDQQDMIVESLNNLYQK
jgi:dTDP-4-amino-4,6-dideoxygalactose transaminase